MPEELKEISEIEKKIRKAMRKDRYRFYSECRRLKAAGGPPESVRDKLAKLSVRISHSVEKRRRRTAIKPALNYSSGLPVTRRKSEIVEAIRKNQVVIVSGETGSGKTTQLPKFCIEAGRGADGFIGCTQPRRIAAVTVSARIAEELNDHNNDIVGHKIRFNDRTKEDNLIKVMTDGILLAEAQNDRFLNEYDTIIVDEAHERSLNIDFILGILRTLVIKRKDLRVIITSATIDTEKFSKAFDNAPVIEVSGRTYPVEVQYCPPTEDEAETSCVETAVKAVEDIHRMGPFGDILVFMPTEADIRETCEMLTGRTWLNATILPLFARLSSGEQKQIFRPAAGRKIVVATNVAETSITIPGIKYVVDTGLARIPRYIPGKGTTALPVTSVSRSSADQRKGRCGRVENGICVRLYSEEDYEGRPFFTSPEILRANLAEVILRMISLKLGEIEAFPFIDPPAPKSIQDGFRTLKELGAIAGSGKKKHQRFRLTEKGRIMAGIPVDPRLARMLIEAGQNGCLDEILVIISALAIRDPRERPADKAQQADQAQAVFRDDYSDYVSFLNIWKEFGEQTDNGRSLSMLKKFCRKHYLSFLRMREWKDIHSQLVRITANAGLENRLPAPPESATAKDRLFGEKYEAVHKSVLSGFLTGIAVQKEKNLYTAAKDREVMIFPGSGLFNRAGKWIVASEIVETSRVFARNVANIDPGWLEELGRDNCRYSWSGAWWDAKRGMVMAKEQVALFGLVIVSDRRVPYDKINPEESKEIFIREALINGNCHYAFAGKEMSFLKKNLKLIREIKAIEDKVRRRDILEDEERLQDFYREKIGNTADIRSLVRMIKKRGSNSFLIMSGDELLKYMPEEEELAKYPEKIDINGGAFRCNYFFMPGSEKDGVTVSIPGHLAAVIPETAIDWTVPGLMREKVESLIKSLPKEYRKRLVPVTDTVDKIMAEMPEMDRFISEGKLPENSLYNTLSQFIYKRFGVDIPGSAWKADEIPEHLRLRIAVKNNDGKVIAAGRGKDVLRAGYGNGVDNKRFTKLKKQWERTGIEAWDFEKIPEFIAAGEDKEAAGGLFPALVDENSSVSLRLIEDGKKAASLHMKGVMALFIKQFSRELKTLKRDMVFSGPVRGYTGYFGGEKAFLESMYKRITKDLFHVNIRSADEFMKHSEKASAMIFSDGKKIKSVVSGILEACHQTRTILFNLETVKKAAPALCDGLAADLGRLVPENFLELYGKDRLIHLERYIRAIGLRAERAYVNPEKDRARALEISRFETSLKKFLENLTPDASEEKREAIEEYFWLIEEFKVSVYAQELKTPVKVSPKRLEKAAAKIARMPD